MRRIYQLLKYGWLHARIMSKASSKGTLYRIKVFIDILWCFRRYKMWSISTSKRDLMN